MKRTSTTEHGAAFLELPVHRQAVDDGELAYRVTGEGSPILLVHGWPLWGFTWRKLLPTLAEHHRCYVVDLLGAGDSRFSERTDLSFRGQVDALARFTEAQDLRDYAIIAHDSGATISRHLALADADRVSAMVMMNTEIPHHRPRGIELGQRLLGLPGASRGFRWFAGSERLVRSKWGFGSCFLDRTLIEGEFLEQFVTPLLEDEQRLAGQLRYVQGIDWRMLDDLEEGHRKIHQPVLFLWGDRDPWFPAKDARVMVDQLPSCQGFETFPGKLFVHEEAHEAIAPRIVEFLAGLDTRRKSA